jgi:hypothetical protein
MKCDSQASLLARTLVSPCLSHELKTNVVTLDVKSKKKYKTKKKKKRKVMEVELEQFIEMGETMNYTNDCPKVNKIA